MGQVESESIWHVNGLATETVTARSDIAPMTVQHNVMQNNLHIPLSFFKFLINHHHLPCVFELPCLQSVEIDARGLICGFPTDSM